MNPHNTQLLYQRYPRLYAQPLPFGFECADGWFDLIDRLSADIESECQRLVKEEDWQWADLPIAEQVKQKFGGLRFYLSDKSNATVLRLTPTYPGRRPARCMIANHHWHNWRLNLVHLPSLRYCRSCSRIRPHTWCNGLPR